MFKCPKCESENVQRIGGGVGASEEGENLPAITYRCNDCGNIFSDKDLDGE